MCRSKQRSRSSPSSKRSASAWRSAILVAEREGLALARALDHGCAFLAVAVRADHRRERRHLHVALVQELLEQLAELRAAVRRQLVAVVQHQLDLALAVLDQPEAAQLARAHLILGLALPLVDSAERGRVAQQHYQHGVDILDLPARDVGDVVG